MLEVDTIMSKMTCKPTKSRLLLNRDMTLSSLSLRSESTDSASLNSSINQSLDSPSSGLRPTFVRTESMNSEVFAALSADCHCSTPLQTNPRNPIIVKRNPNIERMIQDMRSGSNGSLGSSHSKSGSPNVSPTHTFGGARTSGRTLHCPAGGSVSPMFCLSPVEHRAGFHGPSPPSDPAITDFASFLTYRDEAGAQAGLQRHVDGADFTNQFAGSGIGQRFGGAVSSPPPVPSVPSASSVSLKADSGSTGRDSSGTTATAAARSMLRPTAVELQLARSHTHRLMRDVRALVCVATNRSRHDCCCLLRSPHLSSCSRSIRPVARMRSRPLPGWIRVWSRSLAQPRSTPRVLRAAWYCVIE